MEQITPEDRERAHAVQQAAMVEAVEWLLHARERNVAPLTTVMSAAMLIGQIIGSSAKDETHMDFGLDQLIGMMRVTARDWLSRRIVKH